VRIPLLKGAGLWNKHEGRVLFAKEGQNANPALY
jgi:hypothetical protein